MASTSPDQFGCQSVVRRRRATGVKGRGTQGYTTEPGICGRATVGDTGMCAKHVAEGEQTRAKLAKKQEWEAANPGSRWRG